MTRVTPGWNEAFGIYYDAPAALAGLEPMTDPDEIRETIVDLVADFPIRDAASLANFVGLLLTPIMRPSFPDGNVPGTLIGASLERTGKTKLGSEVGGGIILGRPLATMTLSGSEEEQDKRVVALLRRSETMLLIDNIATTDVLDSAVLAMLLTSRRYTGRLLGRSEMVELPNDITLIFTGNNVRASGEVAKRLVPILLQPATDCPEARDDFRHPDLSAFVESVRPKAWAALIGMVENWKRAGRPGPPRRMGGFEPWAAVVGGIVVHAGFKDWLGNYAAWARQANPDGEDLRAFVEAWAETYPDEKVATKELLALTEARGLFPQVLQAKTESGRLVSFAKSVLRKNIDTPVGNYLIRTQGSGSASLYWIERSTL